MNRQEEINVLKEEYLRLAEKFTPEEIKNSPIFNLEEPGETKIYLTKELIEKFKLEDWLKNYEEEAKFSTGGIRGPQNILYPWDTRFPINQMGVVLATLGKALVLKDDLKGRIDKIVAGEVRYNTHIYVDLISRIQAKMGISTHLPFNRKTVPVWMVSFLIFMLDYDGGEFITSSHAISSKMATKDIDNQGSQFLPEMSLRFIEKIKGIIQYAKENPKGYEITLAPKNSEFIKEDFDGYDLYVDYLKKSVAKPVNIELIKKAGENGLKIMCNTVGGCMHRSMTKILEKLDIANVFEWVNAEEDPFFHGIGKDWRVDPETKQKEFFDYSCDFCLFDVVKRANFQENLKGKPVGYIVLITDPDGDRLNIGEIESKEKAKTLDELGMDYITIDDDKIFTVYNPTFSFILIMDFYMKQLKQEGLWENHPRFIVTTTPSSKCWNEWAENNNIKIITTPVGFKQIASIIRKTEKQILENVDKDVIMEDVFGQKINLGKDPRMVFGGEESGGMITGIEDFIESKNGRKALAMREKSAGEAIVIATALSAFLFQNKKTILEHLGEIFKENKVKSIVYARNDIVYYNESEPDPIKLQEEKKNGEAKRDKTDSFYLSLVLALRDNKINLEQAIDVLKDVIPDLDFSKLIELKFTGDATFFQFTENMFVQVRRSGTDARIKGYSSGPDKERCLTYMNKLLKYSGERTEKYNNIVPEEYRNNTYLLAQKIYHDYLHKES